MKAATADQDDPDGHEQQPAAVEDRREGGIEDDDQRERGAERREGRVPGTAQKPEDLDRGERGDDRDAGGEQRPADARTTSRTGTRMAALIARSRIGCRSQRPKRRWRRGELDERLVERRRPEVRPEQVR